MKCTFCIYHNNFRGNLKAGLKLLVIMEKNSNSNNFSLSIYILHPMQTTGIQKKGTSVWMYKLYFLVMKKIS